VTRKLVEESLRGGGGNREGADALEGGKNESKSEIFLANLLSSFLAEGDPKGEESMACGD
jgi:hypothetical protein